MVSPQHRNLNLYARFHTNNVTGTEVIAFFRCLLRHLPGGVVVFLDGGKMHRRADVCQFISRHRRLRVERFPAYAPELNPAEFVWSKAKHSLANSAHFDIQQLGAHLRGAIRRTRNSQQLLWSCIHASTLPWPR